MSVEYLTTATSEFIELQSGLARPYWEANIDVDEKIDSQLVLFLKMNGVDGDTGIVDSSQYARTVTMQGNAQVDTSQSKYDGASVVFDGTSDTVTLSAMSAWNVFINDGTIDFNVRFNTIATATHNPIMGHYQANEEQWYISLVNVGADSNNLLYSYHHDGAARIEISRAVDVTAGVWYNFRIIRTGNTYRTFQSGVQCGADVTNAYAYAAISGTFQIGATASCLNGWIDQVMLSKGIARTTSGFTPSRFYSTPSILGQAYAANNHIISVGTVDREKTITITGTDRLYAGDVTISLDNSSGIYSPLNSNSIFYNKDWLNSSIKLWAGFVNVSGTALVLQKGAFLVDELELDGKNAVAYLRCKDRLKYGLDKYVGLPYPSGTANARVWTGTVSSKAIITDLLNEMGLASDEYDVSAGIDFASLTVSGKTYGETLGKIAAASDGYMYIDNVGKVRYRNKTSDLDYVHQSWDLNTNDNIIKAKYKVNVDNLINEVGVHYEESLASYNASESTASVSKGRTFVADNQVIQTRAQAQTFTSRNLSDYSTSTTFLEIDNVWMPAVDIGDYFNVTDPNLYLSGSASTTFEVYKIRDDVISLRQKLYLRSIIAGVKIGYLSDTGVDADSVVYTGAWTSGFCFLGRDSGTAVTPGFDDTSGETPAHSGGDNNVIDFSGLPAQSIEEPFVLG